MKLDVIDFARRAMMSVEEATWWLEEYHIEVEALSDIVHEVGYNRGFEDGAKESYE